MADYSVGKFVGPLVGLMIDSYSRVKRWFHRFVGICPYKAQSSSAQCSASSVASLCLLAMPMRMFSNRCLTSSLW